MVWRRAVEGVLVGAMGAALAWWSTGLVTGGWAQIAGSVVGGLNGLVAGAVGLYSWNHGKGWL